MDSDVYEVVNSNHHFSETDPKLIQLAKSGCKKSLEQLFRQFEQPVYHLIYRICQNPDEAMEVLQETFLHAFRKLDQFQNKAPFSSWLRKIALNQCMTRFRRWRANDFSQLHDIAAIKSEPGLALDLNKAFSKLPLETRTIVWLFDVEGYSHKEIAALFGKSTSFSKTQLSRAHQKMRDCLQPNAADSLCPDLTPINS